MKRFAQLLLNLFFLSMTSILFAQESGYQRAGGFGGFSLQSTSLDGSWTMEAGGFGAGYLNNNFYLGGGGYGLDTETEDTEISLAYGGILLGYEWLDKQDKNSLNFYLLSGIGGVEEKMDAGSIDDNVWVLKPGAEVEFPLTHWARIGIGGGFRWVFGSDLASLSNGNLSSGFASISFKFGPFGN